MISNDDLTALFADTPVMAILRGLGTDRTVRLATLAWDLGIDWVEIPLQTHRDEQALRASVEAGRERGRTVGAGTVTTLEQVERAAAAGATFTVSPGLDLQVAEASAAAGMPPLPGVATPTEIQQAVKAGLTWLKAFPASELGPGWFRAMAGPFPEVRFVATGGMDADSAGDYLAAGASVVAVGSALEDPRQLSRLADLLATDNGRPAR